MSMKDKLTAQLGDRMRASMGVGDAGPRGTAVGATGELGPPGTNTPVAGKYDGMKAFRAAKLIPLDKLTADPDQPRKAFSDEAIDRLADSLRSRGMLQPIRARWDGDLDRWVIVAGERRFRAARRAGWAEIPCITVETAMPSSEILQDQLIENCLREDLSPLEQALAFKTLMDLNGWSARRLGEELHLSHQTVGRAVALLDLPEEVRQQVAEGSIAPRTAAEIATLETPEEQKEVAERVVKEKLTRDQVAGVVREKAGKKVDRVQFKLEDGSTVTVTGPAAADEAATKAAFLKLARKLGRGEAA
jgi:ParB family transcriptional regulator, chromosome partitioning protein